MNIIIIINWKTVDAYIIALNDPIGSRYVDNFTDIIRKIKNEIIIDPIPINFIKILGRDILYSLLHDGGSGNVEDIVLYK